MIDKFEKALLVDGKSVLTIQAYINDIRQFANWLKDSLGFESDSITETDVREYQKYLNIQRKLKPTSINRKIKSVVAYQKFLVREGICKEEIQLKKVLLKHTADLDRDIKIVEKQDMYRLKRTIEAKNSKRDIAIYYLLFGTGIRCSELVACEIDDIHLTDRNGKNNYSYVLIRNGKGNKSRKVNLNAAAVTAVKEYLEVRPQHPSNKLLIGQRGPLNRLAINKIMDKYSRMAQLEERVNPHSARHTFCSQLIKSGVDPKTVALLSGHSSVDTIYRFYVSSSAEDKQRAVDGLQV
ncbi:tyrosine-type recombinase/integrase [Brevibacillus agri]|uniref:tyrosine-type recombinase/integrase n=1 Tax=Brevibacillus TaxID=55080 RepID=UPI001561B7EC|nr:MULTISPECIES: tyrosine-type recombinase/integrase [Brevibacillus]MBE5393799.1 tyrosine-type recombinase/integrase [Brevibacillus borstelensis]MED1645994.1 tyrosine-type recombinase/integrase [Brevibacillus agri]MED1656307.1 tyrosine-type recombinase/integrase [Brevibacillus agri]MED1689229.1 tyrosine-type recombinase/integrase [Brevibacillus agri]MED1693752.1 tyrosine-type recombinase/integrase [Brevibacillus agri]